MSAAEAKEVHKRAIIIYNLARISTFFILEFTQIVQRNPNSLSNNVLTAVRHFISQMCRLAFFRII